jgi:hypothetical protein
MRTDSIPYIFTFDRLQIEAGFCRLNRIPTQGIELRTRTLETPKQCIFSFRRYQQPTSIPQKPLIQYSLTIQTEKALDNLIEGLQNIAKTRKRRIEIPLTMLKMFADVTASQLTSLLLFFPKVEELVMVANFKISLFSILQAKSLKRLTIESKLFLDSDEKDKIREEIPKFDLSITIQQSEYRLLYPSTRSLTAYAILLLCIFSISLYILDSAEKQLIKNATDNERPKLPINQIEILVPFILILGSVGAGLRHMTFVAGMLNNQYYESIRTVPISTH